MTQREIANMPLRSFAEDVAIVDRGHDAEPA